MTIRSVSDSIRVSRRAFLCISASYMLPLAGRDAYVSALILDEACGFKPVEAQSSVPSLYVFNARDSNRLVLAALFPPDMASAKHVGTDSYRVTLHAGDRRWTISEGGAVLAAPPSEQNAAHVFAGRVSYTSAHEAEVFQAFVVEAPRDRAYEGKNLPVWATLRHRDGSQHGVGNPLYTRITAHDAEWSAFIEAWRLPQNQSALSAYLSKRVAEIATHAGAIANPEAHGERVAKLALPGVLNIRQDLPVGFNFAHQNGRHPNDDAQAVVESMLTGRVGNGSTRVRSNAVDVFPYFSLV